MRPDPRTQDIDEEADNQLGAVATTLMLLGRDPDLARLLSQCRLRWIESGYDNWNGGTRTYDADLTVPADQLPAFDEQRRNYLEAQFKEMLELSTGSWFGRVRIRPRVDAAWRTAISTDGGLARISDRSAKELEVWRPDPALRVFVSHVSEGADLAVEIRNSLGRLSVSTFVAREDIKPLAAWEQYLRVALDSCDALVVLVDDRFELSAWVHQEAGWALGRGAPVIPVSFGQSPQGLLAGLQAVRVAPGTKAPEIVDQVLDALIGTRVCDLVLDAWIAALASSSSYVTSGGIANRLRRAEGKLSPAHLQAISHCIETNDQVGGCRLARQELAPLLWARDPDLAKKHYPDWEPS